MPKKKKKEEVVEETTKAVEVEAPEVAEETTEEVVEETKPKPKKAKEEVVTVKILGHQLTGVVKEGVLYATDGCTYDMPKS